MTSLRDLRQDKLTLGASLLILCFWLLTGAPARAGSLYDTALNPASPHAAGDTTVIVCGGQKTATTVQISSSDIANVWHKTYRMLFPAAAMAEDAREPVSRYPHKGPEWSLSINHERALVSYETRW